jgi:DNA repair exonuclease SbcCD ATPase subunit
MKLSKVEWRNFASYGNKLQTLEFDGDKSNLYLLVGENGAGKSSISDVITFGLYGKLDGKNLKDIPNRVNGNAWVRITLHSGGTEYIIERGLDPSIFNLYIDGTLYDKAGSKSVQEFLVESVIQIPSYVFSNTISLSINDFKSFLKMTPKDKKAIIDKIFGFYIINMMRDLLKEESKAIKETLIRLESDISSVTRSINSSMSELEALIEKLKEDSKDKVEEYKKKLEDFKKLYEFHKKNVSDFLLKESEIKEETRKINGLLYEGRSSLNSITEKLRLYSNDKCPECLSDLHTTFHQDMKSDLEKQRGEIQSQIQVYTELYEKSRDSENKISVEKGKLNEKGGKISFQISSLEDEIRKISSSKSSEELNSVKRIVENLRSDLQDHSEQKTTTEKKSVWIKKLEDILGDKGVKQLAIKSILPSLNANIADLMSALHLPYQVNFNEDFDASIFHLGQEISISTLSTGQMKKVDFVVLLAVLKLMKIRFSSINLLFLDEIFSSIDADGIYTILNTLRKICDDLGLNVFVINHAPMPTEIFDYNITLSLRNSFSEMLIQKV